MYNRLTRKNDPLLIDDNLDPEFVDIEVYERLELLEDRIEQLISCHTEQGSSGQWNANHYMLGMFNGLELALSTIVGTEPEYREFSTIDGSEPDMSDADLIDVDPSYINGEDVPTSSTSVFRSYIPPTYPAINLDTPDNNDYVVPVINSPDSYDTDGDAYESDDSDVNPDSIDIESEFLSEGDE